MLCNVGMFLVVSAHFSNIKVGFTAVDFYGRKILSSGVNAVTAHHAAIVSEKHGHHTDKKKVFPQVKSV